MHYNTMKITEEGKLVIEMANRGTTYSSQKYKNGGHIVRELLMNATYSKVSCALIRPFANLRLLHLDYVDELFLELLKTLGKPVATDLPQVPLPLSSNFDHPSIVYQSPRPQ
jgi:hypothetical protein